MLGYAGPPGPPFDQELVGALATLPSVVTTLHPEGIGKLRILQAASALGDAELSRSGTVTVSHHCVGSADGEPEVSLIVLRPAATTAALPIVYYVHGGGLVAGSYRDVHSYVLDQVGAGTAVVVSVEYRLAPEATHPAPVTDVYRGLVWAAEHAVELGADPDRLIVFGASAGAGLAGGATLMARDRGMPPVAAQMLVFPMLDDRARTASSQEIDGTGVWDRTANRTGWAALLGAAAGSDGVSPYAAPARADDLSGMPPTYIDVGSAEVFRDEAIDYAARLAAAGCPVDLHMWAGSFHGADQLVPDATVSRHTRATRVGYMNRMLAR
jgi:acetyl esterase/lipase